MRLFLITSLFIVSIISHAKQLVPVTSADGQIINVKKEDLVQAYEDYLFMKSSNAEDLRLNEDGSVTITRPKFRFNGVDRRIFGYGRVEICQIYGFEKFVSVVSEYAKDKEPWIAIGAQGKHDSHGVGSALVFQELTCSEPKK